MGMAKLIEDAKAQAEIAAQDWVIGNKPNIAATVRAMLDQRVQEVVAKLLGFTTWYGGDDKWEVDHCNGRSGNSAAGDWLRNQAGDAVRQWLIDQAGELPPLPSKAVAELRKTYLVTLKEELHRRVREKAVADAAVELGRICAS